MTTDSTSVKVYTVNGAASGSSSALPDWLTRKRVAKKGKRAIREHVEGTIDLVQEFEFPEASNKIKTTRDGHHAIATGVYKPQIRCYDLDQLTLKFERHTDAENVDFVILSDDWTKSVHLQADRSIELHTQGGFHYRTRIPRAGRAIAYHYPSCDALVAGSSPDVYRLNLDQGRFMTPLTLASDGEDVVGVNAIDVNPAHQLLAFGIEDNGTVQLWDPRSRSQVGILRLPRDQLVSGGSIMPALPGLDDAAARGLSVTSVNSRRDGLSYAIGTSTGHTLLYDIRSSRPFAIKDLGYGLPVKKIAWIEGGSRMGGDGLVLSADRKVIKIWDRNNPEANFVSITPASDINDVHHIPESGLLMLANEAIQMTSYYIPSLGPAPRWCGFLDNITEELEDQTARSAYEDYKFIDRVELAKLGLDTLVGTPALRPYMHGYFVSLKLYDAARAISRPFAYEEHRARQVQDKMDKLAESRIRARNNGPTSKVNKALAERLRLEEERLRRREERKRAKKASRTADGVAEEDDDAEMDVETEEVEKPKKTSLLTDPRFAALFENAEFEVDENSREFALLNPSRAAQTQNQTSGRQMKTAVEEEEEESDRDSSSLGSGSDSSGDNSEEEDSSDVDRKQPIAHSRPAIPVPHPSYRKPTKQVRMVAAAPQTEVRGKLSRNGVNTNGKNASFGQRLKPAGRAGNDAKSSKHANADFDDVEREITWIPSGGLVDSDDMLVPGSRGKPKKPKQARRGVETFGAGLERGNVAAEEGGRRKELTESERHGRKQRRSGVRSGSKNAFRGL